jgi:leader peptidase (prepilin peptidase)/N-methyltransferase
LWGFGCPLPGFSSCVTMVNMEYVFYFFTFIFGTIIGSFLNVVVYRYNTGLTLSGRSFCFSCNKQLTWTELFPVFSYLVLGGKCRFCKSKISKQYTIVEIMMGIISSLIFWKLGGMNVFLQKAFGEKFDFEWFIFIVFLFVLFGLLVAISVYDFKHKIIPDFWAYSFATVAFLRLVFLPTTFSFSPTGWDFFAGPILALPFALLWLVSGGRWMGLGDAKLTLGLGWFLGIKAGLIAIVLAFWIGAIFGLALLAIGKLSESSIFHRKLNMKSELPFAPFLILGLFLVFFVPSIINLVTLSLF